MTQGGGVAFANFLIDRLAKQKKQKKRTLIGTTVYHPTSDNFRQDVMGLIPRELGQAKYAVLAIEDFDIDG